MEILTEAAEVLRGRWHQGVGPGEPGPDSLTLREAIAQASGLEPRATLIAYQDWQHATQPYTEAMTVLGDVLSEQSGRHVDPVGWSSQPQRTEREVLEALEAAAARTPTEPPGTAPALRPYCVLSTPSSMKRRHVLAFAFCELWSLKPGFTLSELLESIPLSEGLNDWESLALVDQSLAALDPKSPTGHSYTEPAKTLAEYCAKRETDHGVKFSRLVLDLQEDHGSETLGEFREVLH